MPENTPYHHGNLKQDLLDRALALLEEQGPESLSLRALARELGVSNNAPYRHFKSKGALLEAMATEGFLRLAQACHTEGQDWRQRLQDSGLGYIAFASDQPALFRLMFSQRTEGGFQSEAYQQAAAAAMNELKTIISLRNEGDPKSQLLTAWGLVHGLSHLVIDGLYRNDSGEKLGQEQLAAALAPLLDGV